MGTTSKVLLVVGAAGTAAFLLWRFWPKKEEEYAPEDYASAGQAGQPLPDDFEEVPPTMQMNYKTPDLARGTLAPGTCPDGYYFDANTGKCEIWLE